MNSNEEHENNDGRRRKRNQMLIIMGIILTLSILVFVVFYGISTISTGLLNSNGREVQKGKLYRNKLENEKPVNIYDHGYKDDGNIPDISEEISKDKKQMSNAVYEQMYSKYMEHVKRCEFSAADNVEAEYRGGFILEGNEMYQENKMFHDDINILAYYQGSDDALLEDYIEGIKSLNTDEAVFYGLLSLKMGEWPNIVLTASSVVPYTGKGVTLSEVKDASKILESKEIEDINKQFNNFEKLTYVDFVDNLNNDIRAVFIHRNGEKEVYKIEQLSGDSLKTIAEWSEIYSDMYDTMRGGSAKDKKTKEIERKVIDDYNEGKIEVDDDESIDEDIMKKIEDIIENGVGENGE